MEYNDFNFNRLDDYLAEFGKAIGNKATENHNPIYSPGLDSIPVELENTGSVTLLDKQQHLCAAVVKTLDKEPSVFIVGEQGSGKTYMGTAIVHAHARGKGYNCLVVAPKHLSDKWPDHVKALIPDAVMYRISSYKDVLAIKQHLTAKPTKPTFFFVSSSIVKLGPGYRTAGTVRTRIQVLADGSRVKLPVLTCPNCGSGYSDIFFRRGKPYDCSDVIKAWQGVKYSPYTLCGTDEFKIGPQFNMDESVDEIIEDYELSEDELEERKKNNHLTEYLAAQIKRTVTVRYECNYCKQSKRDLRGKKGRYGQYSRDNCSLEQDIPSPNRYSIAKLINTYLKGYFKYLILDEVHEAKADDTQIGTAVGQLSSACKYVLPMTGTLIGGIATHLWSLLWRMSPKSLVDHGFTWNHKSEFMQRYGRYQKTITNITGGNEHKTGNVKKQINTETLKPMPGIMPQLYADHLIGKCVFLALSEMDEHLPDYNEYIRCVSLSPIMAEEYNRLEIAFDIAVKNLFKEKGVHGLKAILGIMKLALVCWADYPFEWTMLKHKLDSFLIDIVEPVNLEYAQYFPKEIEIIKDILKEKSEGRKCWVYINYVNKKDVAARLKAVFEANGIKVAILRSSTKPEDRMKWIGENAPGVDVIISNPELVKTGLDFFDRAMTYNLPTIMFYQLDYNLFTLRQASRRAWRLAQDMDCRTYFYYYQGTLQDRILYLMAKKMQASLGLEGKFSEDGLLALSEDDLGTAIARQLLHATGSASAFSTITGTNKKKRTEVKPVEEQPLLIEYKPEPIEVIEQPIEQTELVEATDFAMFDLQQSINIDTMIEELQEEEEVDLSAVDWDYLKAILGNVNFDELGED